MKYRKKPMIKPTVLSSASILVGLSFNVSAQQCQIPVFEDNFDQASLDTSAWEIMLGDGCDQGAGLCGWGNEELQSYQADNITLANGIMTIEARKERIRGSQYTSGRIRTANMPNGGEWAFGRFEARMKIPDGQGMWPAFWMLPTDPAVGWPTSGEIDIFESVGQSANTAYGTIHYGQPWPDNAHQGGSILMQPGKWSDDFHTYAIEWEADEIRWYVDNLLYSVKTPADVAPEDWPFDGRNNFHLLLNLAVGGTWGGTVDNSALPQTLQVDYVRIYAGSQPNLQGNHLPAPGSTESYSVVNAGSTTIWSVTGGTVSGSGSTVDITWDTASASTVQTLTATTAGCEVSTNIYVGKNLTSETILENYDGTSNMTLVQSDGVYDASNGVLTYTRNAEFQWDVVLYNTSAIADAGPFISGDKAFELKVNNSDPAMVGKEILIQLEDRSVATPDNYPNGRHSSFNSFIEHSNGWQTLRFQLASRIDGATSDTAVDSFLLMPDPGNFTSDTYTFDDIEILGAGGGTSNNPPTAEFSFNCTDLSCTFDGSASTDTDGSLTSWSWDFGDGNTGSGESVSHTYAQAGTYTVTLTVTDNLGATNETQSSVTVTSGGGEATSVVVSSVTTTTQGAGRGQKYGIANVTILDDLGQPVAGATVSGNFSGTWNESGVAVTDNNGVAVFQTSSTASGGVSVNFCVSDVNASLPFDAQASSNVCP